MRRDVLSELVGGLNRVDPLTTGEAIPGYLTPEEGDALKSERAGLRVAVGSAILQRIEKPGLAWLLINGSPDRINRQRVISGSRDSGLHSPQVTLNIDAQDQVRTDLVLVSKTKRYLWREVPERPAKDWREFLDDKYPNNPWDIESQAVDTTTSHAINLGPEYRATGTTRLTAEHFRDSDYLFNIFATGLVERIGVIEEWHRSRAIMIHVAKDIKADIKRLKRGLDQLADRSKG